MYRLVVYYLLLLVSVALLFSLFGLLPYNPFSLLFSTLFLVGVSWLANKVFSKTFNAPTNVESVYISALILALIISPAKSITDVVFLFWAAVLTMGSKYMFAIAKKHVFNPVAIAVTMTSLVAVGSASWWVGTGVMMPFVLLGLLIVRKTRRTDLVFYFFIGAIFTIFGFSLMQGSNLMTTLKNMLLSSSLFFFAFVMLTEPLTTPPTKKLQTFYGIIVGILFAPQFHLGTFFTTPETALVIGNMFAYFVSPKYKVITTLRQKLQTAPNMMDFLFVPQKKIAFLPGQYMEWTLPHPKTDSRGNRRYFTIASSPTEDTLRLGVRFNANGSSFKKALLNMDTTTQIVGAQVGGDFTLPKDPKEKLVFIAGGIGITPFRSMIKYLVDLKQPRQIVQFYANKTVDEVIYYDVFNQAQAELGIRTVYTLTDTTRIPQQWTGRIGRIDAAMIQQEVPDFKERTFYLSGPHSMVVSYEKALQALGVAEKRIKKDFFPGFA